MDDDLAQELIVTDMEPEAPAATKNVPVTDEVASPILKDYFNMDNVSDRSASRFKDIVAYFGDKPEGAGEMMYMLRQLENRLGQPRVGESRLDVVHRYVKITNGINDSEKERDSLLR